MGTRAGDAAETFGFRIETTEAPRLSAHFTDRCKNKEITSTSHPLINVSSPLFSIFVPHLVVETLRQAPGVLCSHHQHHLPRFLPPHHFHPAERTKNMHK